MEAVYELLSTILFFLALVFPAFLFYTLRRRSRERKEGKELKPASQGTRGAKTDADTHDNAHAEDKSQKRYPDAIRRVMETQGIRRLPFDRKRSEPAYRNQYASPAAQTSSAAASAQAASSKQKSSSAAAVQHQPARHRSIKPLRSDIVSIEQQKKQSLESLDRYPVKKRAIILSEIIGKPKGIQE